MIDWVKRNKELLLPLVGAGLFLIVLGGLGVFFQGRGTGKDDKKEELTIVDRVEIAPENNKNNQSQRNGQDSKPETQVFFVEPSASEILDKIEGLDPIALDEKAKEFPGLKIMWPLYFFKMEQLETGERLLFLDVAEDGCGISVVCDVDIKKYPQINEVQEGELLWIAGEIVGLDPEGTGQFQIKTEQIRFGGTKDKPPTAPVLKDNPAEEVVEDPGIEEKEGED